MEDFAEFEWLLFDLDNTIVDFNASSKEAFVSLMNARGVENATDLYPEYNVINHQVWDEREAGLISHEELKEKRWRLFFDKRNFAFDPLEANNDYFETIKTNPVFINGAKELLSKLQGRFKAMIITNGLSEVQHSRIKILKLKQYFEHIVISDEIGMTKPQQGFFEHCENLMQFKERDKVLVIGDTLKSDIKGGNLFGYKTCWFNYYQKPNETDIIPNYELDNLDELSRQLELT